MADQDNRRVAFETARLKLARVRLGTGKAREAGFRLITQVVGEALRIERVGIWLFEEADQRLRCHAQFRLGERRFESGQLLESRDFPGYTRALQQRRALPADNARSHPLTRELTAFYLVPNQIVSMLDAPIIRDGRVMGVICHETLEVHAWSQSEIDFAGSAADLVALLIEQAERIELESALKLQAEHRLESQKLEALGRMGRAVAHDLNNLLMVVLNTAQEAGTSSCPSCTAHAHTLRNAGEVGQRLVRRLFELGARDGQGQAEPGAIDVAAVLQGLAPALRTLAGLTIDLTLDLRSSARVRIPQGELEQLVLNLVVNARDAINGSAKQPGGGLLTISLRDPTPEDDLPPDRVVLEVSDTGAGMDERTKAHLFEPYFTTKPDGSGLGLAIVYGIVKRAGGGVEVASAPAAGSTFRISLPRDLPLRRGA